VLGSPTSITNDNLVLTQDPSTGNIVVHLADAGGNPLTIQSFSAVSTVIVGTPAGNNTMTVDPCIAVPVTVFAGPGSSIDGTPATATETIDAALQQVMIAADIPAASESRGSAGEFLVSRTDTAGGDLTVNYEISGTAVNGTDYATITGSVTITGSNTSAAIDITPFDLSIIGGSKSVILTLISGAGYNVASAFSTATVTIWDDDDATLGSGSVSADMTFFSADGSAESSDGQALVGDCLPIGIKIDSGDAAGESFSLSYDSNLITISTSRDGNGVVGSGSSITLTPSDTIYFVSAANPGSDTPVDDEFDLVETDDVGGSTETTTLCSLDADLGVLHMMMSGLDVATEPTDVEVGEQVALSLVRQAANGATTTISTGVTWSLPESIAVETVFSYPDKKLADCVPGEYTKGYDPTKLNNLQVANFDVADYVNSTFTFYWVNGGTRSIVAKVTDPLGTNPPVPHVSGADWPPRLTALEEAAKNPPEPVNCT